MHAESLLKEGRLEEAISTLGTHLRDRPDDARNRTFLFELLCFNGEFDRAEKHLSLLGDANKDAAMGALLYQGALHAERVRRAMFEKEDWPPSLKEEDAVFHGRLNGKPFSRLSDSDPRIGARLEVFAGGDYMWLPLKHLRRVQVQQPSRLRDLLWSTALLQTGAALRQLELGEVLLPALAPLSFLHPDELIRLGRLTEWCADDSGQEAPYGQKMLLVDGEEIPLLEVRTIEIGEPEG